MNTLMVGYDLNRAKDYTRLIEKLKSYPNWWHYLDSTWLIKTTQSAYDAASELMKLIDGDDELLVINATSDPWASAHFEPKAVDWLKANI